MKKFLSLVLALIMVMSLTVVGAGAKDFTDKDTITYDEAIDVISALEIVDGYTDGSFQPETELNRGQAAKIICNLILGVAAADNLSATVAPFPDVPASHHFAGYISYCAQEGIISGYADGYFRPNGTLSGYAFMKMLLGALGYDQNNEGMVGANWSIQVAKLVQGVGLDKDLEDDFVGSKTVTRQEACLYALNTLQARTVEYKTPGTNITVNGIEINQKASNATYRTFEALQGGTNRDTVDGNIAGGGYIEFAEEHFPRLVLNGDEHDSFQRPQHMWTYKGDKIGSYTDTPDATYEGTVTMADIYDDLSLTSTTDKFNMYIDGMPANLFYKLAANDNIYEDEGPSYLWDVVATDRADDNEVTISKGTIDERQLVGTGPGCVIECYKTGRQNHNGTIVVINTYVGEVVAVNAAEGKHAATIDISPVGKDFDVATENAVLRELGATVLGGSDGMSDNFETSKFELGDIVTFNYAFKMANDKAAGGALTADDIKAGEKFVFASESAAPGAVTNFKASASIKNVAKAETVEGEVKSYTNQASFNLAGTEYKYSKMAGVKVDMADIGTNVIAYLDKQGNVLYFDEGADNNKNYALVLDAGYAGSVGSNTYQAELLYADGTTALVATDKLYGHSGTPGLAGDSHVAGDNTCLIGQWVFHRTDARGRAVLTAVPSETNRTVNNMMTTGANDHKAAAFGDINAELHKIGSSTGNTGSSATRVVLLNTSATVGIGGAGKDGQAPGTTAENSVRVNSGTTIIVKTKSGSGVVRYNVYNGVKEMPWITGVKNVGGVDQPDDTANFKIFYSALTRQYQTYARFLYVDATDTSVFTRSRTNKDLFLVANVSARDSRDIDGNHYYTFAGVVDGEIQTAINLNWDDPATRDVINYLIAPDAGVANWNRMNNVLAINYARTSSGLYEIATVDWMTSKTDNHLTDKGAYVLDKNSTVGIGGPAVTVDRITKDAIYFSDGYSYDLASDCKFFRVENRDVNARVTASTWNAVVTGKRAAVGDRYAYLAISLNRENEATAIYWRELRNN